MAPEAAGSKPARHPKEIAMVLTKLEVLKMKSEIANLRRIANDLAPGTMKLALSKR